MANYATKFIDPAGNYSGGYTSLTVETNKNNNSNQTSGVLQVAITSGYVDIEMKLSEDAPWLVVKRYTASSIDELTLGNFVRVIASDTAEAWIAETL